MLFKGQESKTVIILDNPELVKLTKSGLGQGEKGLIDGQSTKDMVEPSTAVNT